MKELTPNGWIGVLIGIVLFGSIVDHVTSVNCWKAAPGADKPKIDSATEMEKAFDTTKWTTACIGSAKCLQYHPPASGTGKIEVAVECGTGCATAGLEGANRIGAGYLCHECGDSEFNAKTCKTYSGDVLARGKPCYTYTGPKFGGNDKVKKILCLDTCKSNVPATGDITVGCAKDIESLTGTKTDCSGTPADCASIIFGSKCYKEAGTATAKNPNIDSLTEITDAYNREKWNVVCATPGHKCLQYYPDKSKTLTGKVQVVVECGVSCSGAPAATRMSLELYTCSECDTKTGTPCKGLDDVKTAKECYSYSGERNKVTAIEKEKKIYCHDSCHFVEVNKVLTVGCAGDLKTVPGGTPAECTKDDALCEKLIKAPGSNSGGSSTDTSSTTKPKHGNKVTGSTCLIGSIAILLFAASEYVNILN